MIVGQARPQGLFKLPLRCSPSLKDPAGEEGDVASREESEKKDEREQKNDTVVKFNIFFPRLFCTLFYHFK